jgi:hypothetical protein
MKTKKDLKAKILGNKLHIYSYILGNLNGSMTPSYPTDLSLTRICSIRFFSRLLNYFFLYIPPNYSEIIQSFGYFRTLFVFFFTQSPIFLNWSNLRRFGELFERLTNLMFYDLKQFRTSF